MRKSLQLHAYAFQKRADLIGLLGRSLCILVYDVGGKNPVGWS
jgi:hypothetical protein